MMIFTLPTLTIGTLALARFTNFSLQFPPYSEPSVSAPSFGGVGVSHRVLQSFTLSNLACFTARDSIVAT